ncbi:unnamed protein product [Adineta steineri]|uniref:MAM domain-containing protein n=1 Tax=Adineta steineri TaxID=433720 RepID=A0A815JKJ3_9BILA|nr:unnamed protein product [Adineta steineri]CAF4100895.1 unnamed protein product [Adineta steineri]
MKYMINVLFFVSTYLIITNAQILYQCNFDSATITTSCLQYEGLFGLGISEEIGSADEQPPIAPLSDVTSSLKPTTNGESCNLPYQLNSFTWDMYFCNEGYCQTSTDSTSKCSAGKFGHVGFAALSKVSFTLNTDSGGTDGIGEQCLTYYYYLSNITGTAQSITVRKQEVGDISETIDSVINSPYNGWIKHQVSFHTSKGGYRIYFDFEKTFGPPSSSTIIAIDEISVLQGDCPSEPVTQSTPEISVGPTTSITTITESDMTTNNSTETISTVQTTDTTVTESSSSMKPITTTATITTTTATSTTTTTTITTTTTTSSSTTTTTASTTTIITSTSTTTSTIITTTTLTTATTITSTTTITTVSTTTTATSTSTTTSTATVVTITTVATTINTNPTTSTSTTVITTTATTTSTSVQTTTSTTSTSSASMTTTTTMLTTTTTVMANQPSSTTMVTNSTPNLTESTTADSLEDTTKKDPSKRTLIIALATGIPSALTIVVIIAVWMKRSAVSGLLSGISHTFNDIYDQSETTVLELTDLQDDYTF